MIRNQSKNTPGRRDCEKWEIHTEQKSTTKGYFLYKFTLGSKFMVECFLADLYNELIVISIQCDMAILDAPLMSFLPVCASVRVLTIWVTLCMRLVYISTTLRRVCMLDYMSDWWHSTGYLLTFHYFYQSIEACVRCNLPLDFDNTNIGSTRHFLQRKT